MTPGRLFLLSILCLVLAGLLLFATPPSMIMSIIAAAATILSLVSYFAAISLRRARDRGEQALAAMRERIARATEQEILDEHRVYHDEGFKGVNQGELLIFYRTDKGWLLVPLLEELAWVEIPAEKIRAAHLIEGSAGDGFRLRVEFETSAGHEMVVGVGSTLQAPRQQTRENVEDLLALRTAIVGETSA